MLIYLREVGGMDGVAMINSEVFTRANGFLWAWAKDRGRLFGVPANCFQKPKL